MPRKIENLSEHWNKNKTRSIEEAAKAAARRFRDNAPRDAEEPEALASGDMKKFLDDPNKYYQPLE